jgi:hypothetical protein
VRRHSATIAIVMACLAVGRTAAAQAPPPDDASGNWLIVDNSFLVEEAFNQDPGKVQNIVTWTRARDGVWSGSFTQEWPVPGIAHQLSYTIPFGGTGRAQGLGDVMLNYRYQIREQDDRGPAVAQRVSVVLPTGRAADGLGAGRAGVQVNLAVSRQFGNVYVHANAGDTWVPDVTRAPQLAGSGIWRAKQMVNLMLESVVVFGDAASATVSPGIRGGWNVKDGQVVIGAAAPITRAHGHASAAVLTYFSYELGFHHRS